MKDFIDVGSAPTHEDCAQVGSEDYHERAKRECRAYIAQLRRLFGQEPSGAVLRLKANPHDFGNYFSVVCHFDNRFPASLEYALRCESESPEFWDEQARRELSAGERRDHV
jgi:hypothetical protein